MSITAEPKAEPRRRNRSPEFTERDLAALTWIGEQYGARLDVLGVLLGRLAGRAEPLTISGVRNQVERWKRRDHPGGPLVSTERALGDTWVTPTRYGLDRAELASLTPWRVPGSRVRHCHAVNIVRLAWESDPRAAESPWISERLTYQERGNQTWHIPDGVIKDPKHIDAQGPARYVAIEVELTHKGRRTYQTEVFGNLRAGIGVVSYYVADQAFADRLGEDIRAVLQNQGSTTRFAIQLLPEVPGVSYMR